MYITRELLLLAVLLLASYSQAFALELSPENIDEAIQRQAPAVNADPMRPAFHLTPSAVCMSSKGFGSMQEALRQPLGTHFWVACHSTSRAQG